MPIGNYQMPRIGDAQQFTPQTDAIPQNAQPMQGQLPMQQQLPQQAGSTSGASPALGGGQSFDGCSAQMALLPG